jgi:hypothetical protein
VDGITFTVCVPEGRVGKGDAFKVTYPVNTETTTATIFGVGLCDDDDGRNGDYYGIEEAMEVDSTTTTTVVPIAEATPVSSSSTYMEDMIETATTSMTGNKTRRQRNEEAAFSVPTSQWRKGFCSCFEGGDCLVDLMGRCCAPILIGQVMQRLKLNWF